jgi:four helix bundle protein
MTNYHDLDAWKVSIYLVNEIYELTNAFPNEELYSLTSQTKRAAISTPANIAEDMGRQYKKDTTQFLHIARGSLYELETLIHISLNREMVSKQRVEHVFDLIRKNLQILNGFINYMGNSKLK